MVRGSGKHHGLGRYHYSTMSNRYPWYKSNKNGVITNDNLENDNIKIQLQLKDLTGTNQLPDLESVHLNNS